MSIDPSRPDLLVAEAVLTVTLADHPAWSQGDKLTAQRYTQPLAFGTFIEGPWASVYAYTTNEGVVVWGWVVNASGISGERVGAADAWLPDPNAAMVAADVVLDAFLTEQPAA